MSYLRPESISPITIAITRAATLAGMVYAVGMVASGLGVLPAVGLGTGLWATELGSGLLLGVVSLSGFLCAQTADRVRRANHEQLAAIHKAEAEGVMPDGNPYRLLDAGMERSPLVIDIARIGGVVFGVAGALGILGAATISGAASVPLMVSSAMTLVTGIATHRASRVAEDAVAYAEQKTRETSRALRSATPAAQWARSPTLAVGTEFTYPPAGHFVNKYLEQQAAQEAVMLEDLGRK